MSSRWRSAGPTERCTPARSRAGCSSPATAGRGELEALQDIPSRDRWSFPPRPWTHHVRWIAPDPRRAERLLAGIELGGLMCTDDGGATFTDHRPGAKLDAHSLAWHPRVEGRAYQAAGDNPGQVMILFDEDYVAEADLERVFKRSGLFPYLAALTPGQPLPTLGQLVRARHNVLVFTQEPVSGRYPWDMNGFSWIQDTPLGAVELSQFSCRLYRGAATNPLLMMNDWADVFPPRRSPNLPLVTRGFILRRARQCLSERHHLPNLILTDFYDSGDLLGAVRVLNGLGDARPAPIVPLNPLAH